MKAENLSKHKNFCYKSWWSGFWWAVLGMALGYIIARLMF